MPQIYLEPPGPFLFRTSNKWLRWKHCFKQFLIPSRIAGDANVKQVNTLIYRETDATFLDTVTYVAWYTIVEMNHKRTV